MRAEGGTLGAIKARDGLLTKCEEMSSLGNGNGNSTTNASYTRAKGVAEANELNIKTMESNCFSKLLSRSYER